LRYILITTERSMGSGSFTNFCVKRPGRPASPWGPIGPSGPAVPCEPAGRRRSLVAGSIAWLWPATRISSIGIRSRHSDRDSGWLPGSRNV